MSDRPAPSPHEPVERLLRLPRLAWYEWAGLALWVGAVLFWLQFALASAAELEPQAALLGWGLVAILGVGGIAAWAAHLQNRARRRAWTAEASDEADQG